MPGEGSRVRTLSIETRGTDTRQRIIEAVWEVLAENGLPGLTVRLVGQKAGIFKKYGITLENFGTAGAGETVQAVISGCVVNGFSQRMTANQSPADLRRFRIPMAESCFILPDQPVK